MKRIVLALVWMGCGGSSEEELSPIAVHCQPVTAATWPEHLILSGVVTARPGADAVVSAEESGRLVRVLVDVGEEVVAGQALAEVAPVPLEAVAASAEADLRTAEAERVEAQARRDRTQQLVDLGTGPVADVELAQAALARAVGHVRAAREALRSAREHLGRATVRAPFTGVVVQVYRREGEVVDGTPSTPLLELADAGSPQLLTTVTPSVLGLLAVGQRASVRLADGADAALGGRVAAVVPVADPTTGLATARIGIVSGEQVVTLGVLGEAEVAVSEDRQRTVVPADAVRAAGSDRQVVRCVEGQAEVVSIDIIDRRDGLVAVGGVAAGDRVVVGQVVGLEDGMALEVLP